MRKEIQSLKEYYTKIKEKYEDSSERLLIMLERKEEELELLRANINLGGEEELKEKHIAKNKEIEDFKVNLKELEQKMKEQKNYSDKSSIEQVFISLEAINNSIYAQNQQFKEERKQLKNKIK